MDDLEGLIEGPERIVSPDQGAGPSGRRHPPRRGTRLPTSIRSSEFCAEGQPGTMSCVLSPGSTGTMSGDLVTREISRTIYYR